MFRFQERVCSPDTKCVDASAEEHEMGAPLKPQQEMHDKNIAKIMLRVAVKIHPTLKTHENISVHPI